MEVNKQEKNTKVATESTKEKRAEANVQQVEKTAGREGAINKGRGREFQKNRRKPARGRRERVKPEFDQKILTIRRVTRVVAGGRRFSFSVALVAGNRNGSVGVGVGKASDTVQAIEKAFREAKKNMVHLKLTEEKSIPFDTEAKYCASKVVIRKSPGGGLVAGSSVRSVLELAGLKDVSAKILTQSKNKLNNARAAVEALLIFAK